MGRALRRSCVVAFDQGNGLRGEVERDQMARCTRSTSPGKALVPSAGNGEAIEPLDGRLLSRAILPRAGEARRKGEDPTRTQGSGATVPWPWGGGVWEAWAGESCRLLSSVLLASSLCSFPSCLCLSCR